MLQRPVLPQYSSFSNPLHASQLPTPAPSRLGQLEKEVISFIRRQQFEPHRQKVYNYGRDMSLRLRVSELTQNNVYNSWFERFVFKRCDVKGDFLRLKMSHSPHGMHHQQPHHQSMASGVGPGQMKPPQMMPMQPMQPMQNSLKPMKNGQYMTQPRASQGYGFQMPSSQMMRLWFLCMNIFLYFLHIFISCHVVDMLRCFSFLHLHIHINLWTNNRIQSYTRDNRNAGRPLGLQGQRFQNVNHDTSQDIWNIGHNNIIMRKKTYEHFLDN